MTLYAHTPVPGGDEWDDLLHHLKAVADEAERLAAAFGAAALGRTVGLWHDLGKITPEFQSYLKAAFEGRPHAPAPHARWGAALAYLLWKDGGWEEVGLPIAGHHAGLANPRLLEQVLPDLLRDHPDIREKLVRFVDDEHLLPPHLPVVRTGTSRELLIRMLLSALRDADWLVTERHFQPDVALQRGSFPSVRELLRRFDVHRADETREATGSGRVLDARADVYRACVDAAAEAPGVFRLTVPTGGGKTISSLAFALNHARKHALRRVIVALPYTSIIDQTAAVYRRVLGGDAVIEHHSQVEPPLDAQTQERMEQTVESQLATENWDAPVIVTTTVQLFESLFHNLTTPVRKIHNIARSVLILDEVQTLPPALLAPITDVLRTLVDEYGVTLVLSTATQPALEGVKGLRDLGGREIVPDNARHFRELRRVHYERRTEPLTWQELAQELEGQSSAMAILNTRRDALRLLGELESRHAEGLYHLSTLLCGRHRRVQLATIRERLKKGEPVKLVATQVVEAGVDIDFPAVYRALAPLDRIVQAAGRCNRAGAAADGRVVIFEPAEGSAPAGPYKRGIDIASLILAQNPPEALHDPAIYEDYFRRLYNDLDLDAKRIQEHREDLDYPKVAELFRMIEEDTVPVVVDYEDSLDRLDEWRWRPSRKSWQALQPYLVSLHKREVNRFLGGAIQPVSEGLYQWTNDYDSKLGLKEVLRDPSDLIVIPPERLSI